MKTLCSSIFSREYKNSFFRLRPHGDPLFIGESLRNALGAVFARQIRVGLNVDDLKGNQVRLFDGGFKAIHCLAADNTGRLG